MLQKCRIQWLALGDKNSKFFHAKIKSRWDSNKILAIEDA